MASPKIGQTAKLNGKNVVWSGQNYGWQSSATHNKLKDQGKFRVGTQALDRLTSSANRAIQKHAPGVKKHFQNVAADQQRSAQRQDRQIRQTAGNRVANLAQNDATGKVLDKASKVTNVDRRIVGAAAAAAQAAIGKAALKGGAKPINRPAATPVTRQSAGRGVQRGLQRRVAANDAARRQRSAGSVGDSSQRTTTTTTRSSNNNQPIDKPATQSTRKPGVVAKPTASTSTNRSEVRPRATGGEQGSQGFNALQEQVRRDRTSRPGSTAKSPKPPVQQLKANRPGTISATSTNKSTAKAARTTSLKTGKRVEPTRGGVRKDSEGGRYMTPENRTSINTRRSKAAATSSANTRRTNEQVRQYAANQSQRESSARAGRTNEVIRQDRGNRAATASRARNSAESTTQRWSGNDRARNDGPNRGLFPNRPSKEAKAAIRSQAKAAKGKSSSTQVREGLPYNNNHPLPKKGDHVKGAADTPIRRRTVTSSDPNHSTNRTPEQTRRRIEELRPGRAAGDRQAQNARGREFVDSRFAREPNAQQRRNVRRATPEGYRDTADTARGTIRSHGNLNTRVNYPSPDNPRREISTPRQRANSEAAPRTGRTRDNAQAYAQERERTFRRQGERIIRDRLSTDKALEMSGRERDTFRRNLTSQMRSGARRIYAAAMNESNDAQAATRQNTLRWTGSGRQAYQDNYRMGVTRGRTGGLTEAQYRARSGRPRSSVGDPQEFSPPPSEQQQARASVARARTQTGRRQPDGASNSGSLRIDTAREASRRGGNLSGASSTRQTAERAEARPATAGAPGRRQGERVTEPNFVRRNAQRENNERNIRNHNSRAQAEQLLDDLRSGRTSTVRRGPVPRNPEGSNPNTGTRQRHGHYGDTARERAADQALKIRNQQAQEANRRRNSDTSRANARSRTNNGPSDVQIRNGVTVHSTNRISSNRGGRRGSAARQQMEGNIQRAFEQGFYGN